jgi:hypothetical protein
MQVQLIRTFTRFDRDAQERIGTEDGNPGRI